MSLSAFSTFSPTGTTSAALSQLGLSKSALFCLHICTRVSSASATLPSFKSPAIFDSSFNYWSKGQHIWSVFLYLPRKVWHDRSKPQTIAFSALLNKVLSLENILMKTQAVINKYLCHYIASHVPECADRIKVSHLKECQLPSCFTIRKVDYSIYHRSFWRDCFISVHYDQV